MTNKLLEHFKRMQAMAGAYLEPIEYPNTLNHAGTRFDGTPLELDKADLFINDMLYMLDGPEQREAEASVGNTYIEDALRTESGRVVVEIDGNEDIENIELSRLLHAAMGLTTEAGEFLDALKKTLFYGKPLDLVNLREEIGDIMWYLAIACDALGTDFETEQARNIAKLKARYPEKFAADKAIERDLKVEREVLEQ